MLKGSGRRIIRVSKNHNPEAPFVHGIKVEVSEDNSTLHLTSIISDCITPAGIEREATPDEIWDVVSKIYAYSQQLM